MGWGEKNSAFQPFTPAKGQASSNVLSLSPLQQKDTHAHTHQFQAHDLYAVLEDPKWRPHQATKRSQQVDLVGRTGHLVNSRTVNCITITFVQTAEPSTPSSSRLSKQQNRQHHHVCPNSRTVNTITFVQTAEPSTASSSRLSKQQNRQHQVIIK